MAPGRSTSGELNQRERPPETATGRSPPARPAETGTEAELAAAVRAGKLSAEELLSRYCTLVYARFRSYEAAARSLALDRRTVKAKIDREWLPRLRERQYRRNAS